MADASDSKPPTEITFHHIKSGHYRVIHADGAFGGPTPNGLVHMGLFSERNPIPTAVTVAIDEQGHPQGEVSREVRKGVVREFEVGVVMKPLVALQLAKWLMEKAALAGAKIAEAGVTAVGPEDD